MTYRPGAVFLFLLLLVAACSDFETAVDVDLPEHEPALVLGAFLAADSTWRVQVSESVGALDPSRVITEQTVTNAIVEVYEGAERVDVLRYQDDGYVGLYEGMHRPEPGRAYLLRARAPGFGAVEAPVTFPMPVPVSIVDQRMVEEAAEGGGGEYSLEVQLAFRDPRDAENYYLLAVEHNRANGGTDFTSSDPLLRESEPLDDVLEENAETIYQEALFRDVSIDGQTRRITIRIALGYSYGGPPSSSSDQYRIVLASVSEAYYRYETTLRAYRRAEDNPFAEPVKVYTNVEGGYGIVAGYSESAAPLLEGYGF